MPSGRIIHEFLACSLSRLHPEVPRRSRRRVLAAIALAVPAALASHGFAGDEPCGIFVSALGENTPECGLSPDSPCATIQFGVDRAAEIGATCVFIQTGAYVEFVKLEPGVNLFGGFDLNWEQGPVSEREHLTVLTGAFDASNGIWTALFAQSIPFDAAPTIADLIIRGPIVPNGSTINGNGRPSMAILAQSSGIVVLRCRIEAGQGGLGLNLQSGTNASPLEATASMIGADGSDGETEGCSTASVAPGAGGSNPLVGINSGGGAGGAGGAADTACGFPPNTQPDAGETGQIGFGAAGGGGGLLGPTCGSGGVGIPAQPVNGAGGSGGSGFTLFGLNVLANAGTAGSVGEHGSGGGGGGGAGGCNSPLNHSGGAGGGGGAGGLRAPTAGLQGRGGGGAFGIVLVLSNAKVSDCLFVGGVGGNGAPGGKGGIGQAGGAGGSGGSSPFGGETGGTGGAGAHGGHSGGGGGGAGGASIAITGASTGSVVQLTNVQYIPGTPGSGGAGGAAAPADPPNNDGNPGGNGAAGLSGNFSAITLGPVNLAEAVCDPLPCAPPRPKPCLGDLNADGIVDGADLGLLLSAWGMCAEESR